ncbi:MAG: nucleotidyltransferase domain-containing protein [Desulfobacterales bacterium]|nr:nucleotidyltransferase domain-containing protein [Desulfobacterales bacterium]
MATALELKREDWARYKKGLNRKVISRRFTRQEKDERDRLLNRIRELAQMLKSQFGVRKVILFGSLARTYWFGPGSDVDLAVEGLETKKYWKAWKLAEDIIADRRVDFVEIESLGDSLKKSINKYGVEL